jgi:hypothetical protein
MFVPELLPPGSAPIAVAIPLLIDPEVGTKTELNGFCPDNIFLPNCANSAPATVLRLVFLKF